MLTKLLEITFASSRKYESKVISKPVAHLLEQTKDHLPEVFQLDNVSSHKRFFVLGKYFRERSFLTLKQIKLYKAKFYLGHLNAVAKLYPGELVSETCLKLLVHNLISPM
jgi:hypothetical protein